MDSSNNGSQSSNTSPITAQEGNSEVLETAEGADSQETIEGNGEALNASESSVASGGKQPSNSEVKKAADKVDAKQSKGNPDKYTIKVDGQVLELSKDEMVKYAQLGKAGQARMEEAARIKQEAIQLVQMLRSNPEAILADPNVLGSEEAVVKLAQKILSRKLEDEQKSPEVREKERLQKELEDLRSKLKRDEEQRKADEYERLVQQKEAQLEEQISEAFEATNLPRSPIVLKRLADVMLSAAENDKNISPKQALNIIKNEMQRDIREYMEALEEDALEQYISAEKLKKLRAKQVAKAKAAQPAAPKPAETKAVATAEPKETAVKDKKIDMKKFLRGI